MKSFELTEIKKFMHLLLRTEIFDKFLLSQAVIHTAASFEIDGHINKSFYSEEDLEQQQLSGLGYLPYGRLRPVCFELIKGRRVPTYFKFVLMLSPENLRNTVLAAGSPVSPSDVSAVFMNLVYQNERLMLTTGVSYRTFVPDKSFEKEWDTFARRFLEKNEIIFLEI